MKVRRAYVPEKLFKEVTQFAEERWATFRERSPEGVRITRSFPYALLRYIETEGGSKI